MIRACDWLPERPIPEVLQDGESSSSWCVTGAEVVVMGKGSNEGGGGDYRDSIRHLGSSST